MDEQLLEQLGLPKSEKRKIKSSFGWDKRYKEKARKREEDEESRRIEEEAARENAAAAAATAADGGAEWGTTINLYPLKASRFAGALPRRTHLQVQVQSPEVTRPLPHGFFAKSSRWSGDGSLLLTNSEDNVMRLYHLPESLRASSTDEANMLKQEDVDTDAPSTDPAVYESNASASTTSPHCLEPALTVSEGECVYDYAFYPNMAERSNSCFVTSSRDVPLHLWDSLSGKLRASYRALSEAGMPLTAYSVAFSPTGSHLVAGYKGTVRVFDSERAGETTDVRATQHNINKKKSGIAGIISSLAFSPTHTSLFAVASFSGQVAAFDVRSPGRGVTLVDDAHKGGVTHVLFSKCGRYIYSGARKDGRIRAWDTRLTGVRWDGKFRPAEEVVVDGGVCMTRESPTNQRITFDLDRSGRYLFTGCHSGYVKVYSTRDFSLQSKIPIAPGFGPVNSVSVNPALPVFSVTTGSRVFRVSPLCDAPYTRVTPFLRPFFAKRHKQLRPAPEKEEKPVDLQEDPTVVNPALRENENTTDTSNAMEVDEAPPEEEGVRRIPPDSSSSSASSSSSLSSGSDTESDDAPEVRAFAPLLGAEDQLSNADRSLVGQAAPCMRSTLELWSGKVLYFPLPATKQPAGAAEAAADQQQPAEETCPETTAGEAAPMAG